MNTHQAQEIIRNTFEAPFEKTRFAGFIRNLLNHLEDAPLTYRGRYIPDAYKPYIHTLTRIGKFSDGEHRLDVLVITLRKDTSLERARTVQRNFIAWYLNGSRPGGGQKDAALVAYVAPDQADWRFSLVRMEYRFEKTAAGRVKVKEAFTPARRWSFLVGANEKSHTAQSRLVGILADDEHVPTLADLEHAFDIETVTREFFLKYRELFLRAKEALDAVVNDNPRVKADFDAKGVDTVNFAKKLLGQIVFLYFLQKKGWFGVGRDAAWGSGSPHFLRELFQEKQGTYHNFYNDILEPLFYDALRSDRSHNDDYYQPFNCKIPFLNGGLFDPIGNYDWVHTDIHLPDALFSNTRPTREGDSGDGILDVFDRYNFTVREDEPLEKEVAIDPELLGKAYEKFNAIRPDNFDDYTAALQSGKKGAENRFNKKFGVYYTPRAIVHYMCQQSLINYLYTALNPGAASYETLGQAQTDAFGNSVKTGQLGLTMEHRPAPAISKADLETLITCGERVGENEATVQAKGRETRTYAYQLPESIRRCAERIDRALAAIAVCDPAVGSGAFPVGMMHEIVRTRNVLSVFLPDPQRTIYRFKRECIEHSLYGVDIDPGAVEIAKLRLWLSLVVDEDDITTIKPLPNLDYKIVCGNSLIGFPENWNSPITREIEALKHAFFDETNPTRKRELRDQINAKIEARYRDSYKTFGYEVTFDVRTVFSEVFRKKGGFDVVIGNPPYVQLQKMKDEAARLEQQHFKTFTRTGDIYALFYEKGGQILKDNGTLCFISSNKWMQAAYGEKLRKYFEQYTQPLKLIVVGPGAFEAATVDTNILVFAKRRATEPFLGCKLAQKTDYALAEFVKQFSVKVFVKPNGGKWEISSPLQQSIAQKIEQCGTPLKDWNIQIYRGVLTGYNTAFIINGAKKNELIAADSKSAEIIKPLLRGRDIQPYKAQFAGSWLIDTHNGYKDKQGNKVSRIHVEDFSAVQQHLNQYWDQLAKRAYQGHTPYNLRNCAYHKEFEKEKVVWKRIGSIMRFSYDDTGAFCLDSTCFATGEHIKFLVGVLNSKLCLYELFRISPKTGTGDQIISVQALKPLHIPKPDAAQDQAITALVDQILAAKQRDPAADTRAAEAEIDRLVYQLYGLTEEEIRIVEGQEAYR